MLKTVLDWRNEMLHRLRCLTPEESGEWYPHRGYAQKKLFESGIRPGDVLCRLGNAYVYGFVHLSKMIANVTGSDYSHAAMVIGVDDHDILIADVDTHGLKRQYFVDWCDDVRGDSIGVLRHDDEAVRRRVVENCNLLIREDPYYECDFDKDDKRFACVELICWCYMRAGLRLCKEVTIQQLPGWSPKYYPFAALEGISRKQPVWCVGNKSVGLYSSEHLRELIRLKLPEGSKRPVRRHLTVNGA